MGQNREGKMTASRKPMHVDERFEKRMKLLQKKIMMKQGVNISLRELTAQLPTFDEFSKIESKIIGDDKLIFELNFDVRKRK